MKQLKGAAKENPVEDLGYTPGDFYPNGAFNEHGLRPLSHNPETELYWFVDMLCTKRRRNPETPPWEFSRRISRSRFTGAFPNAMDKEGRARWTAEIDGRPACWWQVAVGTAAESAVLLGGLGSEHMHELLAAETARRHDLPHGGPSPEAVDELLRRLGRLGLAPGDSTRHGTYAATSSGSTEPDDAGCPSEQPHQGPQDATATQGVIGG